MSIRIEGLDQAVKTLNEKVKEIHNKTRGGLYKAALVIKKEAILLTPVVTGNLRGSSFVLSVDSLEVTQKSFKGENEAAVYSSTQEAINEARQIVNANESQNRCVVAIGYGAFYAGYIHENPNAGRSGRPGASTVGQWKFLQQAIQANVDSIIMAIKEEIK